MKKNIKYNIQPVSMANTTFKFDILSGGTVMYCHFVVAASW
jgi:hypothetical protein